MRFSLKIALMATVSIIALGTLPGCTTLGGATAVQEKICDNKDKIIAAAEATISATEKLCPFDLMDLVDETE